MELFALLALNRPSSLLAPVRADLVSSRSSRFLVSQVGYGVACGGVRPGLGVVQPKSYLSRTSTSSRKPVKKHPRSLKAFACVSELASKDVAPAKSRLKLWLLRHGPLPLTPDSMWQCTIDLRIDGYCSAANYLRAAKHCHIESGVKGKGP